MSKTFDLTENETRALMVLVRECLNGMGGERPSDLDTDPYTWCAWGDLKHAGWTTESAKGTYGALEAKGLIVIDRNDPDSDFVTDDGYRYCDTIWDEWLPKMGW